MNRMPSPVKAEVLFNQPYLENATSRHVLDLYVPEGRGPFPLVVWIHGGGWSSGDRRINFAGLFMEAGLALASLEYRLTSEGHPFPAQMEDCLSAVTWLRKKGEEYRLDRERIGVAGHSAGAHLSALIATAGENGVFGEEKIKVQAAVLLSPPLDLARGRGKWPENFFPWNPRDPFARWFFKGGEYDETFAQWASPSSYLRKGLPPMLAIHGMKDSIVPIGQVEEFCLAVQAHGGEIVFQIEPEGNHDFTEKMIQEMVRFFQKTLQ